MKKILQAGMLWTICGCGAALQVFGDEVGMTRGAEIAQTATVGGASCLTGESAEVVKSLYSRYQFGGHHAIQAEARGVLRHYFDRKLTELILSNQKCEQEELGVCRISANILYHAQDATITDLRICTNLSGEDVVDVRFKNFGVAEQVKFKLTKVSDRWKISNILYQDGSSLMLMLSTD